MRIYIDDLRPCPTNFDRVFRTAEDFLSWLDAQPHPHIQKLSLDHDLGPDIMSGYDLVKELVHRLQNQTFTLNAITFHTANPIGHKNMLSYMSRANQFFNWGITIHSTFYGF